MKYHQGKIYLSKSIHKVMSFCEELRLGATSNYVFIKVFF